jgi:hypothetical protein
MEGREKPLRISYALPSTRIRRESIKSLQAGVFRFGNELRFALPRRRILRPILLWNCGVIFGINGSLTVHNSDVNSTRIGSLLRLKVYAIYEALTNEPRISSGVLR